MHLNGQDLLDLINIFIIFQYILGFDELFNQKLSKLFSNFYFIVFQKSLTMNQNSKMPFLNDQEVENTF